MSNLTWKNLNIMIKAENICMKKHFQTELHEVFSVSKIITIYPSINLYEKRNEKFYGHDFRAGRRRFYE